MLVGEIRQKKKTERSAKGSTNVQQQRLSKNVADKVKPGRDSFQHCTSNPQQLQQLDKKDNEQKIPSR